ncbi:p71 [Rhizobium phage 16-3]|uniref:p71 n=1 Tax=Rhizobium phage 16-3 TaxID=10704 RepID=UPI00017BA618|nr:p71 [Rhizobium phage 16-3]ABF71325.1 p71 [Rhizobium phage 16-3]
MNSLHIVDRDPVAQRVAAYFRSSVFERFEATKPRDSTLAVHHHLVPDLRPDGWIQPGFRADEEGGLHDLGVNRYCVAAGGNARTATASVAGAGRVELEFAFFSVGNAARFRYWRDARQLRVACTGNGFLAKLTRHIDRYVQPSGDCGVPIRPRYRAMLPRAIGLLKDSDFLRSLVVGQASLGLFIQQHLRKA